MMGLSRGAPKTKVLNRRCQFSNLADKNPKIYRLGQIFCWPQMVHGLFISPVTQGRQEHERNILGLWVVLAKFLKKSVAGFLFQPAITQNEVRYLLEDEP